MSKAICKKCLKGRCVSWVNFRDKGFFCCVSCRKGIETRNAMKFFKCKDCGDWYPKTSMWRKNNKYEYCNGCAEYYEKCKGQTCF